MAQAPFPIDADLTSLVIAYQNQGLIADEVMPRVRVARQEFKYLRQNNVDGFTVPETRVARKGRPNMVDTSATESTDSTVDYALDDVVPLSDLQNADGRFNPLARAATYLAELIALAREVRVASLVTTIGNYPSSQRTTLSGTTQWSHASSNPVAAILDALDVPVMRPNVIVMGQQVYTKLIQHTAVVQATKGTSQSYGVAEKAALAQLFGVDRVLVGAAWVNTAKKGQTATMARGWGKYCALLHMNPSAFGSTGATFGFTAQWGERIAGSDFDRNVGMRGGQVVRVGESVKELIADSACGYFFADAVA
jgi:hypothetical protein